MSVPTVPASKSRSLRFGLRSGIGAVAVIALMLGLLDYAPLDHTSEVEQRNSAAKRQWVRTCTWSTTRKVGPRSTSTSACST